jgi:eukaryotic-like serine/threonine-protein kinase
VPSPSTATDLVALVRKSRVVDPSALDSWEARLALAAPHSPKQLATLMVREGLLTVLQARQLLRGKWRNFLLCDKYKLLEHLGTGGMGRVYLCEHARMGRRVAIKILPPERASEEVCLERFFREARAAAALDHINIVRAHDIDRDDSGPEPLHFLVMEYVDGRNLQSIVDQVGPLSVERSSHYVSQSATGLQHAHEAGLVHRDVKPANLLLDRSGTVKILDLGLARFFDDAGDDLTRRLNKHAVIGTADYLAPEQALNGHAADIRADIYSLGVTYFFLLTGRSPFKEGSIAQKLIYHQKDQPEPVRNIRPDVPDGVAQIISRMLAKDPKDRFQEPIEVRLALDPWTRAIISPPPESEMPRLSRAARRSEPPTAAIARSSRSTIHNSSQPPPPAPKPAAPQPNRWSALRSAYRRAAARISGWLQRFRRKN